VSARETLPPRGERAVDRRSRAEKLIDRLHAAYPDARCALTFETPFQLLVATILSAQCTDERVNMVTPVLFARFPTPRDLAEASLEEIEQVVRSTGFFRQKARNIQATARMLLDEHDGVLPTTVTELARFPGAARKTANVVVSNCFPEHAAGIAVDTHVQRISRRLGLARAWPPEQIERELMRVIPHDAWNHFTHLVIDHGRAVCTARAPACPTCPLVDLCPSSARFPGTMAIRSRKV
jgi:endonuclease-3